MNNKTKLELGLFGLLGTYLLAIKPAKNNKELFNSFNNFYYAHRGLFNNKTNAPENSIQAFIYAIENGYGMEVDVQLTKDKIPVVFHDFSLKRAVKDKYNQPVDGYVYDYTYEELKQFHLFDSNQTIPLFKDFLKLVDGKVPLIIEYKVKNSDLNVEVCSIANDILKKYKGIYCIESFNPLVVFWYKNNRPDIIRGQLSSHFNKDNKIIDNIFKFLCENLLFNWLTKPNFIAYNHKYEKNISRRLCYWLYGNTAVAWTIKNEKQLINAKRHFDLFIFDSFIPKNN